MAEKTINDLITDIESSKADIQSTIAAKGVTVPEGTSLANTASYIAAIPNTTYTLSKSGSTITLTGSDGSTSSVTDTDTNTNTDRSSLAYSTTAAATAAKVASMTGFALSSGQYILLKMETTNSATSNVTLNVNSTGAKPVKIGNSSTAPTASNFPAGEYIAKYDGTNWILTRIYWTDNNTTYSAATTSAAGLMSAADKTKLDGIATGANKYSHPAGSATSKSSGLYKFATDSTSHISSVTAVTKADITGLGIPAQDTTYSVATSSTAGLVKSSTTGTTTDRDYNVQVNADGTMKVNVPWTNTHYTTGLYVGATNTKANAATSNGGTYLKLYDDNTKRSEFLIKGSGATYVTSDASGNITISSTNSVYDDTSVKSRLTTLEGKAGLDKTGTITSVKVNGTSVATSGDANITSIPWSIVDGHSDVVELTGYSDANAGKGIVIKGGNSGYGTGGTNIRHTSTSSTFNTLKLPTTDGTFATQEIGRAHV